MNRVRIFACAGTGMALSALGLVVSADPGALMAADTLSRSTGVAMLGVALLAAGLVFRAAVLSEQKPRTPADPPRASEYRRGFADRVVRAQAQLRQPTPRGVVVSLRRAVAEQGAEIVSPADMGTVLPASEIERLQDLLHNRAAQLVARNAGVAKRRFMRSGVDLHGFAPQ